MIEIKRIYKGTVKRVTIYTDSELGQAIKNNSDEIWLFDNNAIITKSLKDEDSAYPFKVYFRNGVKIHGTEMGDVREKSLVLQAQLVERINKLQASLKKKKDKIRYERQFKDIASTLFAFEEDSDGIADFESENQEIKS